MRINSLFMLLPLALVSCANADSDEDGLTNGEEAELGTDPDNADTDGDGLNDAEEVNTLGTDPLSEDSDGDTLSDSDEVDAGTDPLSTDSDGDAVADNIEVSKGSDALNKFSWPGADLDEEEAHWPSFIAQAEEAGIDGDTYALDETFPNFEGTDAFGNELDLYQFYGQVVVLDFSAGWCPPCQAIARGAEDMFEDYRDDGLVIIHAMNDDYSNDGVLSDPDFTMDWAEEYDLTFPVLEGGDITDAFYNLLTGGFTTGYPTMAVLDQEMRFRYIFVGGGAESQIERAVEELIEEGQQ